MPVAVFYDPDADALVIGANVEFGEAVTTSSEKFRDAERRPKAAIVIDDPGPRILEVRGQAETPFDGGEDARRRLGAPFRFTPAWIRLRPATSWPWALKAGVRVLRPKRYVTTRPLPSGTRPACRADHRASGATLGPDLPGAKHGGHPSGPGATTHDGLGPVEQCGCLTGCCGPRRTPREAIRQLPKKGALRPVAACQSRGTQAGPTSR